MLEVKSSLVVSSGQIVATDFRAGNVSSNTDNLGFIKTCQDALPKGTKICWGFI
jgi:hypothetical protein